jgi:AcrR family transcriptional regulator
MFVSVVFNKMSVLSDLPVTRAARRKQQTRHEIIAATMVLLREIGYTDLTIRAITERADIGYGTFYLHFADKDEAVWAAVETWAEQYADQVNAQLADLPHPRKEFESWVMLFEYVWENRQGMAALFGTHGSATLIRRYSDWLVRLHIRNMEARRYVTDVDLPLDYLAQFIVGALLRLMIWWIETPNSYTPRQMAEMLFITAYRQAPPE